MSIAKIAIVARELAKELGKDESLVAARMSWWLRHHFAGEYLYIGEREPVTRETLHRMAELKLQGASLRDVADELHVSHEQVRICQKLTIET